MAEGAAVSSGADLVAWLEAELGRVERLAEDAPSVGEPWTAGGADYGPEVRVGSPAEGDGWYREGASSAWSCDDPYDDCASARASFVAEAELVASFGSPVSVLRRVSADRQILAEHASDGGDCRVCCEEGVSEYVHDYGVVEVRTAVPWPCRTVRLLAEAWGWEAA